MKKALLYNLILFCFLSVPVLLFSQSKIDSAQYVKWTKQFEAQKGKLPCPLTAGEIDFKILYLDSDRKPTRGMDMMSTLSAVSCCMDGRVVAAVQGQNDWSVIIAHGDYFCVFSNLETCNVKAGDNVKAGQIVGAAKKRPADGKYVVHVEIWNGLEHLWPADWFSCGQ